MEEVRRLMAGVRTDFIPTRTSEAVLNLTIVTRINMKMHHRTAGINTVVVKGERERENDITQPASPWLAH